VQHKERGSTQRNSAWRCDIRSVLRRRVQRADESRNFTPSRLCKPVTRLSLCTHAASSILENASHACCSDASHERNGDRGLDGQELSSWRPVGALVPSARQW
jgi:hypothetical protein